MADRILRVGAAGLGRAFSLMLPTFAADARVAVVAGADPRPDGRARFTQDTGGRGYETVEAMCEDPNVEAVYISTPHQFHRANVEAAARAGKHVLVEKPMALSLDDGAAMIEAAQRAGVALVVGHSHSFDAPIAHARALIASNAYGPLRMINALQYTDFLYRPRRPEELATRAGGGVIFNQAPHQVDVVRLLGGGRVRSVRAHTGIWDEARPTEGAYSAFLMFENGACATLSYSGYAHFDSDEFNDWIGESGMKKDPEQYGAARAALGDLSGEAELRFKATRNYGGADYKPPHGATPTARAHQHFGLLIASCERADLRPQSEGVWVYGDGARRFTPLDPPAVPRGEVMDELYDSVVHGKAPLHDGAWALATMEVCFAILQSARENREIVLAHQCGLPQGR